MKFTALNTTLLVSLFGAAVTAGSGLTTQSTPAFRGEKHVLANGLQLITHVDKRTPLVALNLYYLVGSRDEPSDKRGLAHLVEHLMFDGGKRTDPFFKEIAKAGGGTESVNASTHNDHTIYYATVAAEGLEYALWLESDRLATLADSVTEEKLARSREIIRNERRDRVEDSPLGILSDVIPAYMYPPEHPYFESAKGHHEALERITLADVRAFLKEHYVPNKLSLSLAGDLDPAKTRQLVEKYFGSIPAGAPYARPKKWIPKLDSTRVIEFRANVPTERIYLTWLTPPYFSPGHAELELATAILAEGLTSRLYYALIGYRDLATDVGATMDHGIELAGYFVIRAVAQRGKPLAEVEQVIRKEIDLLARTGPTSDEVARAKARVELSFMQSLSEVGGANGKANLLNHYNTLLHDPNRLRDDLARYRGASVESLKAAVKKWLREGNPVICRIRPEKSRAEIARTDIKPPPPLTPGPPRLPAVQTATLANGLQVYLVPRHDIPLISARVVARAGSVEDPPGKAGLAAFTTYVMQWESSGHSLEEITSELDDIGIAFDPDVNPDYSGFGFQALRKDIHAALEVLSDIVINPTFNQSHLEHLMGRSEQAIDEMESLPAGTAAKLALALGFGPDHPYGAYPHPKAPDLKRIKAADLKEFHRKYWRPRGSAILFVGDLKLETARRLAQTYFGEWKGQGAKNAVVPPIRPAQGGKLYVYDQPGATQAQVIQLLPLARREDSSEIALAVAESVWGGGPEARINQLLREQKGYTYAAMSASLQMEAGGVWWSQTSVQSDKLKEALIDLRGELRSLGSSRQITEEELRAVKINLVRRKAQAFETHEGTMEALVDLWASRKPPSSLKEAAERITSVDLETVRKAVSEHARPEQAILLVVGDMKRIGGAISGMNGMEVVQIDSSGRTKTAAIPTNGGK
jgi:zinc protease